ncbi:MAG: HNH endonuclease [Actinomycetota bacterium]
MKFAHCEPHHITPWERGGPTDLSNLVPLCSHHHAVHEGGRRITLVPNTRRVLIN